MKNNRVDIISNSNDGARITPSYIYIKKEEIVIGNTAKNQLKEFENLIYNVKRLIGRNFTDKEIQEDIELLTYEVENDGKNKPLLSVKNRKEKYYPEEISAMILKKLKEDAESYLNHQIKDVVITVPAYFNQNQRNSTIKAGNIAGFKNIDIIDEPIAAAIAYAFDNNNNIINKKNICVFDLGGGTFDVTILEINNKKFNVKAIGGDGHLGGEDFDNELIKFCIKEFNEQNKIDISSNKKALRRLKIECERVKKDLSSMNELEIEIESLSKGKDFSTTITREVFENLCDKYFKKCITCLEKTIKESGISKDKIDNVLIVGGSTRIPKIQEMIEQFFNKKDIILKVIQQDEAIAYGAVIKAYHNFNLIELKIVNVNPLSLGIITKGGLMCTFIPKNSILPIKKTKKFKTVEENQKYFGIAIYEGERIFAQDNTFLTYCSFDNIRQGKKGEVIIKITFELNEKKELYITIEEEGRKNIRVIEVNNNTIECNENVERKIEEAKNDIEKDLQKKKNIEAKFELINLINEINENKKIDKNQMDKIRQWINDHQNEKNDVYYEKIKEVKNRLLNKY